MYIFKSKYSINPKKIDNLYFSKNQSLSGRVTVPGDKSISQRALIISLISSGKTIIEDILDSEDVYHTLNAVKELGANIKKKSGVLEVKGIGIGNLLSPSKPIYMGNSGTGTRLLLGLVAGSNALVTFYGDESLTNRPMERVVSPLLEMGASVISAKNTKLPITISGARLKGFTLPIDYKLLTPSAQVKSAILLAALSARGNSFVTEYKETRNYTERMLKSSGVFIQVNKKNKNKRVISIKGTSFIKSKNIKVAGDPSSAVFLAVAAIITKKSSISIENVLLDKFRLTVFKTLKKMGANIRIIKENGSQCKIIVKSSKLKNILVKSNKSSSLIDEYPILSIAAACGSGDMVMEGLSELRFKESDRYRAIINGLNKAGVTAVGYKDSIKIIGKKSIKGGCTINAENDHRIAMSFNILSLVSEKPILVKGNRSICTSFPSFFDTLKSLGVASSFYERN